MVIKGRWKRYRWIDQIAYYFLLEFHINCVLFILYHVIRGILAVTSLKFQNVLWKNDYKLSVGYTLRSIACLKTDSLVSIQYQL